MRDGTASCYIDRLVSNRDFLILRFARLPNVALPISQFPESKQNWGYVDPADIKALFDEPGLPQADFAACMEAPVSFPAPPEDNPTYNWGGDFPWEEYDQAVQGFLTCAKDEVFFPYKKLLCAFRNF